MSDGKSRKPLDPLLYTPALSDYALCGVDHRVRFSYSNATSDLKLPHPTFGFFFYEVWFKIRIVIKVEIHHHSVLYKVRGENL